MPSFQRNLKFEDSKPNTCCGACHCTRKQRCIFFVLLWTPIIILACLLIAVLSKAALVKEKFERNILDADPVFINSDQDEQYERAKRLGEAIKIQTVSYNATHQNVTALREINALIERLFPAVHSSSYIGYWQVNQLSRLYRIEGTIDTKNPYLLSSHLDVVPAGNTDDWEHNPFLGGIVKDAGIDYIYGRGAIDNKNIVFGILEALEHLAKNKQQPRRTFYIAFGHDEEVYGHQGAGQIKHQLRDILIDSGEKLDFILDEGLPVLQGVFPGAENPIILIGVTEKGRIKLDAVVNMEGQQFHSSIPPRDSAIGILSKAIVALKENRQPSRFGEGPELDTIRYISPHLNFINKIVMANTWLFSNLISKTFAQDPATDALQRTTTAVTLVEGGVKDNVIPAVARAVIHHRIHPADTTEGAIKFDVKTINDERVKIVITSSLEPTKVSPYGNDAMSFQVIANSALDVYPLANVAPGTLLGNTDSIHYANLTSNIYRLTPTLLSKSDKGMFHGINERISVHNYNQVVEFYHRIMKTADFLVNEKTDFEESSGAFKGNVGSDDLTSEELLSDENN